MNMSEAELAQVRASQRQFAERLNARLCVVCGKAVESYDQVGRCFHADPCGHRQGQGKVPTERLGGRGK